MGYLQILNPKQKSSGKDVTGSIIQVVIIFISCFVITGYEAGWYLNSSYCEVMGSSLQVTEGWCFFYMLTCFPGVFGWLFSIICPKWHLKSPCSMNCSSCCLILCFLVSNTHTSPKCLVSLSPLWIYIGCSLSMPRAQLCILFCLQKVSHL